MKPDLTTKLPAPGDLKLVEQLNSPFPYYLNDDRKNLALIGAISLFVIGFLPVYKPFQSFDEELTLENLTIFGSVTFIVLFISIIAFPKLFPGVFDPVSWTVKKYVIQTLLNCFIIGTLCIFIDKWYICPHHSWSEIAVHAYTQVALIGIIPATIITLLLRNNMLQENLREAIQANQQLEKIRNLKSESNKTSPSSFTIYSDTSERLTLNLPDLLFIQADDNYSTIFWMKDNQVMKKLLRVNLKNIETQINNSFTLRCHRSFIVNVHAISSITGNTNGYKLQIKDTNHAIPVSRPKGKEVMEKIQELKNMMELY